MRIDRKKFMLALVRAEMTTTELAEKAGISRATVSSIKRGASCSERSAFKIADALGVKLETILETK